MGRPLATAASAVVLAVGLVVDVLGAQPGGVTLLEPLHGAVSLLFGFPASLFAAPRDRRFGQRQRCQRQLAVAAIGDAELAPGAGVFRLDPYDFLEFGER